MTEGDVASSDFARSIENVVLYVMHITTGNHPLFCLLVPVRVGTDVEVSIEDADTERRDYECLSTRKHQTGKQRTCFLPLPLLALTIL